MRFVRAGYMRAAFPSKASALVTHLRNITQVIPARSMLTGAVIAIPSLSAPINLSF
jgi:hypothetical protein